LHELADEEIVVQLMQVKGIGRWTAEMFLIFCLGRLDVLPVTDLGVRKAIQKIYSLSDLPKPAEMLSIFPWKPYRSVATRYLWNSLSKFDSIG
jgi:DNA-3-methyladenine glycosylase II